MAGFEAGRARWAAACAAGVLAAAVLAGCGDCRDRSAKRDAAVVTGDAPAATGDAPAATGDATPIDAAVAIPDAAAAVADAGGGGVDAGGAAVQCPPWRGAPAAGHAWLFARAASAGVSLTMGANQVDIYVRPSGAPLPGDRADADDPCAVAAYDQTATRVRVLAAAIGFSSQDREFAPQRCTAAEPCAIELPRSLDARYYVASARGVAVRAAAEVPPADRVHFAAALGGDSLARAKALNRPLADELDRAERATSVPALDQVIHYTESTLRKRCDARCLDAPALDPAVRDYLRRARRPSHTNPFELRVAPDHWPVRER